MADHHATAAPSNLHYLLLIVGGLLVGFGIENLYWSFGDPTTELNLNFNTIGSSALDNIHVLPHAAVAFGLIFAGASTMIFLNSRAWRYTGGY
jgi:hypothetical protein